MKVKEVEVTANLAWSPGGQNPIYLATGTAAQQLDATFSTNSALEIHELNLSESGHQMPKRCSVPVDHRYHKLVWGGAGMKEGSRASGLLVGGLDQGVITLYDADKLISGQSHDAIIASKNKHTGPVQALDFNPFQPNLLASGASESEVYIWDLNKPSAAPMTPGAKSQPADDVRCVAWNMQVQHILATTFATRCVVWDLRKNDPIIKVSDSTSRMRTKVVAWHPEVATQLCLASEDDHTPVIQIWDLRLASSPIRTLESHQRGILSVAWCQQDSDLLLSCGKDNRIVCWNPNNGDLLCELASSNQWSFDVSWCPRNPAVIASAAFDGRVSVYSIMGGQQQAEPSSDISDSFPGMEAMKPIAVQPTPSVQLKKAPKWLKRPCGATFGFGGKLVTFRTPKPPANQQQQQENVSTVQLSSVVTEQELVERSLRLETSIENQNVAEFCESKISSASSDEDKEIWRFMRANFSENSRVEFLNLLGYNVDQVASKVESACGVKVPEAEDDSVDHLASNLSELDTTVDKENAFEAIAAKGAKTTRNEEEECLAPLTLCTDDSPSGLLTQSLLSGNIELSVELCMEAERTAEGLILAWRGGPELLEATMKRYFSFNAPASADTSLIRAIVSGDWRRFLSRTSAKDWRVALAAATTYASQEEFPELCSALGDRLGGKGLASMLCYICAGDVKGLVTAWMRSRNVDAGPKALQDLVEVVMSLRSASAGSSKVLDDDGGPLAQKLAQYAGLLASQGALDAALTYLQGDSAGVGELAELRERLSGAIGRKRSISHSAPTAPASRVAALRRQSHARTTSECSNDSATSATTSPAQRRSSGHHYSGGSLQPATPPAASQTFFQPGIYNPAAQTFNDFRRSSLSPDTASYQSKIMPPSVPQASLPPAQPSLPPAAVTSDGPGWNDPPPLTTSTISRSRLSTQTKTVSSQPLPEPITQPLMGGGGVPAPGGGLMPPPISQPPTWGQPGGYDAHGYGVGPVGYDQAQPLLPPPVMGGGEQAFGAPYHQPPPANFVPTGPPAPAGFPNSSEGAGAEDAGSGLVPPANFRKSAPEQHPVEKGPIPQEHKVLQEVFDGLRSRCVAAANHPQTRRKLEDVGRKLEILYDKLRDQSLTTNTVTSLHQLTTFLRSSDFGNALSFYTSMVSGPSFAEIAAFMPAIKVLIQQSAQLQVRF